MILSGSESLLHCSTLWTCGNDFEHIEPFSLWQWPEIKTVQHKYILQNRAQCQKGQDRYFMSNSRTNYIELCQLHFRNHAIQVTTLQKAGPGMIKQVLPALANDHMISFLDTEAWWNVRRDVGVPLLIPVSTCNSCYRNNEVHLEDKTWV